jgi:predicted small metal-binding protein
MAWTFYCSSDQSNLTAGSKDELAMEVQQHVRDQHGRMISRDEAMDMVNREARQTS